MKRIKAKKMATGGLMSMPPFIKSQKDEEDGITPYDVNTPKSSRKGLPQRILSPSRTRFNKGGQAFPDLDESGDVTQKDILIGRGVIKKAMGGLLKRKKYRAGDEVLDEDTFEEYPIKDLEEELAGEQVSARDKI